MSPESIPTCLQLAEQFRLQRMAHEWPHDVLPVELLLYYSWLCCETVTLYVIAKTSCSLHSPCIQDKVLEQSSGSPLIRLPHSSMF